MDQAELVISPRTELRLLDPELVSTFIDRHLDEAAHLLDAELEPGWPDDHDEAFLRMRLGDAARGEWTALWGARAIIRTESPRQMIGHVGFHGPPGVNALDLAGAVELGYTVFPSSRGMGFATEVAGALMQWAERSHGVTTFVASVAPSNVPSLAVIRRLGFVFEGEVLDDVDGLEHVFSRRLAGVERDGALL